MSDSVSTSERDPLDLLIEEFLALHRSGEVVTAEVFAEQYPEHREQLLELLPTLLALEDVKRDRVSSGTGHVRVALPTLDRLGDFRIDGELGRGGMGVVFEAVQESLNRRVALKVLPQASLLTGNQLERFRREAQIAARLHHTNIVPVYGSGESDGYHWYAMQYLAGQSLDRWRERQSELTLEGSGAWSNRARFVARLGAAAANALSYAHGLGTLHRDIKPGNFLLDQDDHLWVTDFGLAKALEAEGLTNSGDILGTLQYMAPEQFAGTYDVRSEVYALGVTLYELLTLKPAFRGRHRSELMERVQAQRIEPLARVCPDVPLELAIIIGKAMAREPADRYQDAHALEQDLEAFLEDRPIQARRLSTAATMWRWCRRNRGVAALAVGAVGAVVLAAVTGWAAYVVTGDALDQATASGAVAKKERARAETNLHLSLAAFGDVFDALVGRDRALSLDEDPDTGDQTIVVNSPVSPRDVVLLRQMLAFYDQFASENAESQSLRYEAARAYRRVGAIHSRLGEPESLVEASTAFEKARSGFEGITDRNVARDLATLHIDVGHLYELQYQEDKANESFKKALALLEQLPNSDSSAVRLERAEVLFELSRTSHSWEGRGRGPGGRSPRRREELHQAEALLQELASQQPDDPEVRALQARVLMEGARHFDVHDNLEKALVIWRDLVTAHPASVEYRFQFCQALLAKTSQLGRPRSPSGSEERLVTLREADASAELLFSAQPLFREGRAMLLQVRSRYGHELHQSTRDLDGDGAIERRKLAGDMFASALQAGLSLVSGDGILDFRYVRHITEARCLLGLYCLAKGEADEAKAQALATLELSLRQVVAISERPLDQVRPRPRGDRPPRGSSDGRRGDRPPRGLGEGPRGDRPPRGSSDGSRGPPGEGRRGDRRRRDAGSDPRGGLLRGPLRELVEKIDDKELNARVAEVEARVKELLEAARRLR